MNLNNVFYIIPTLHVKNLSYPFMAIMQYAYCTVSSYIGFNMHTNISRVALLVCKDIMFTIKHSRGKTFTVHQQYSLCRENLFSLPI